MQEVQVMIMGIRPLYSVAIMMKGIRKSKKKMKGGKQ